MGLFDGIGDAQPGKGGVYFLEGSYVVDVDKVFTKRSRKKEDLFIVECTIVECDAEGRRAGQSCTWIVNFKHDAALGNVKAFIGACNGINKDDHGALDEQVTEAVCDYAVSDENPLAGTRLKLQCTQIETRDGNPFTLHDWSYLGD